MLGIFGNHLIIIQFKNQELWGIYMHKLQFIFNAFLNNVMHQYIEIGSQLDFITIS